jgi:hypothetical protein
MPASQFVVVETSGSRTSTNSAQSREADSEARPALR